MDGIAEQTVGFAHLVRGLPQISSVVVLELADACKRLIVDEERRILAVRTLETVDEGKKLVRLDVGRRRGEGSLPCGKKPLRLMHAVAIEEGILFGIAERLAELLDEIAFKVEGIVVEQFFRDLYGNMELVRVENNLVEGRITEGERCAFLDPRCGWLRGRDVDLVLAARRDRRRKGTQDILLAEDVNEALVVLLRYEITAACVRAFLQHVLNLSEIRAQRLEHRGAVGVARPALLVFSKRCARHIGDGLSDRTRKFRIEDRLTFHALNVLAERENLILHLLVCLRILCREASFLCVFIQERLCLLPESRTLFTHCQNLIHVISSLSVQ